MTVANVPLGMWYEGLYLTHCWGETYVEVCCPASSAVIVVISETYPITYQVSLVSHLRHVGDQVHTAYQFGTTEST